MLKSFPRHTVNLSPEVFGVFFRLLCKGELIKGERIKKFEETFANYIDVKYACGVSSGRTALCLALAALNFAKGSEIILAEYNFGPIAQIVKNYGLRPVFIKVNLKTYNIEASLISQKITSNTKAILVTHMFGKPCDLEEILKIAYQNNLIVIEDCAHSCGAEYKGKKVGSFGTLGCFSFAMGKSLPCFGGGMLTCNDDTLWERIKEIVRKYKYPSSMDILANIFKTSIIYFFTLPAVFSFTLYPVLCFLDLIGGVDYLDKIMTEKPDLTETALKRDQYRLNNLQATIGLVGLKKLETYIQKKIKNAQLYCEYLQDMNFIELPCSLPEVKDIYLYYNVKILKKELNKVRRRLLKKGIDTKKEDMVKFDDDLNWERYYFNLLEILNSPFLQKQDILYISQAIKDILS